ncbi:hypothetical protein D3C75_662080 [compost metagenome]
MKRLIRKAEINMSDFFVNLLYDNNYTQSQIEEIINSNSDCLYSGEAFRVFYFDAQTNIVQARDNYLKENNLSSMRGNAPDVMWGVIDKLIVPNGEYQSFAQTMSGINSVKHQMAYDQGDFSITIKFNVSNGLSIEKLYSKYEDGLSDYAKKAFEDFGDQQEIMAKFDSDNFEPVEPMRLITNIMEGYEVE